MSPCFCCYQYNFCTAQIKSFHNNYVCDWDTVPNKVLHNTWQTKGCILFPFIPCSSNNGKTDIKPFVVF